MGKVLLVDKMKIQMLREQGYGGKATGCVYPPNNYKLSMVKKICQHVDRILHSLASRRTSTRS